jgi:hypothetical protein
MLKCNALIVTLLLPLLSACGNQHPGTTSMESVPSPSPIDQANSVLVDMPAGSIATGKAVAFPVNQSVSGIVTVAKAGTVEAFDIQVGNYNDSSDGMLGVKLCQGDTCSNGTASIAESQDNKYLEIQLVRTMDVASGSQLRYTLDRTAGTKPFAVWTYVSDSAETSFPGGVTEQRVPKIGLRYRK